jgi:hypothetical protein
MRPSETTVRRSFSPGKRYVGEGVAAPLVKPLAPPLAAAAAAAFAAATSRELGPAIAEEEKGWFFFFFFFFFFGLIYKVRGARGEGGW